MVRDYDTQLLESVAVRRRRLRDALLFGPQRTRRTFDENLMKVVAGLCVAAVLCAGAVGWSYLRSRLREQDRRQAAQAQPAVPGGTEGAPVPADWVGTAVTFQRLRLALARARVPADLFVLPDRPRPPAGTTTGYYVIARGARAFSGGVVEFERARVAAEFATEDEACRWLYGELVGGAREQRRPVQTLDPAAERDAAARAAALAADARARIAAGGGAPVAYPLAPGTAVDAFGQESGSVLFPSGVPFARRGLPPVARRSPSGYHRYRVARAFTVTAALSPPAPGGPGGGVRFTVEAGLLPRPPALPTIWLLLRDGYLDRLAAPAVPR
ncbi:TNT domain-containing protein [Actinomadura chibensis]|uniref:DUF4237 domain-containing protein n=1 Tax=Actinomadura chibensis TaxID=392828 RepID=A0A5D0NGU3_9ACTN|nr:TNT domain-containing protein [Actinomadura chibensis]TYB43618.1 DUF4237 domain-containing protein [Actinomadura chibensis]